MYNIVLQLCLTHHLFEPRQPAAHKGLRASCTCFLLAGTSLAKPMIVTYTPISIDVRTELASNRELLYSSAY